MKKRFYQLALLLFLSSTLFSADLISVKPITKNILVVEYRDGHIDYFGLGQDRYDGNKVYHSRISSKIKWISLE